MTVATVSAAAPLPAPTIATPPVSLADALTQLVASIAQLVAAINAAAPAGTPATPAVQAAVAGGGDAMAGCSCHAAAQATTGTENVAATTPAVAGGANAGVDARRPTTQTRENRSKRTASTADQVPATPTAGTPIDAGLKRKNPRSIPEMLDFVRKEVDNPSKDYYNRCGHFSAFAYGWNASGVNYAIDQWNNAPSDLKHPGDTNPPAGALVFWKTGSAPGHVAISMGDGMVASNDIRRKGKIDIVPLSEITKKWGADYQGWTPPYFPEAA